MAIIESIGRLGATLAAMVQTRLELATVEIEEESQRFLGYLLMGLLALFLFAIALVMVALFVVVLFWDSYRLQALFGMAGLFALAGVIVARKVKASIAGKPALLSHTLAELNKDIEFIRTASHADDN
ncbi:MAG: phage holin family protein [Pseudomonadota bacterium]